MRHGLHLLPFAVLLAAPAAVASESTFTKLNLDACKTLEEDQAGVILGCKGLKDYPVLYKEGDARPSLFYGSLDKAYRDSAFETFSAFSSVNSTLEWRVEGERPFATILRFFISNTNQDTGEVDEKLKGQVLVISRVGTGEDGSSCVVGLVDALANKDANRLAQSVADKRVRGFRCGVEQPQYYGERGPLASEFTSNLESLGLGQPE